MNKLTISLGAVAKNYKTLQKQLKGAECGAVVKANGYGLGAAPIAKRLANEGCKSFFVATFEEGIELRKTLKTQDIYIFHGVQKNEVKEFLKYKLIPILNNQTQLETWPKDKQCGINFASGMFRLGLIKPDFKITTQYNVKLLMSHLKNAENKNDPVNNGQRTLFAMKTPRFPNAKYSLCNSYGIYLGKDFHFDIARPGIALYGGNPTPGKKNPMKNVVKITVPIIQINEIKKGMSVGYGWDYIAKQDDIVATIPLGYADGILRTLGNKGKVYCGKYILPIVGRISMDLITIKINNLPPAMRKLGQIVEILGDHYNICDMAADAGTIEYEIITRLGNRFQRLYV